MAKVIVDSNVFLEETEVYIESVSSGGLNRQEGYFVVPADKVFLSGRNIEIVLEDGTQIFALPQPFTQDLMDIQEAQVPFVVGTPLPASFFDEQ